MDRQSGLQAGDNYSQNDDGDAESSAAGHLLLKDQDTHDEDPDEAGCRDAGHYGHRYMDQSHLVDHQGREEEAVGNNDAGIQKFTQKTAPAGFCDVGLFLEDDLTQRCDEGGKDCGSVTEGRGKQFGIHSFLLFGSGGSSQFDFSSLMLMTMPIVMTIMPRICFQVMAS